MTSPLVPRGEESRSEDTPHTSSAADEQADEQAEDPVEYFSNPKLIRPIKDAPQG
jgi:hypothetical protein